MRKKIFFTVTTANTDAMSWLESQGITMITTTEGGIISSAMESGQSIALTGNERERERDISSKGILGSVMACCYKLILITD